MYGQLRVARSRAARPTLLQQRRLLATPPPPPGSGLPPTPPPTGAPVRPVVVTTTAPITPGSSTLASANTTTTRINPDPIPPPPSQPPKPPRRFFRRFLIYTTLGALTFYAASGYVSTRSDNYRDFFASNFPGGEFVADYADDHGWESFGIGSVSKKAIKSYQSVTGTQPESDKIHEAQKRVDNAEKQAVKGAEQVKAKAVEVKDAITGKQTTAQKVSDKAHELKDKAVAALHRAEDKVQHLGHDAKEKVDKATKDVPFNFSDGVEGIVREAEKALGKAEAKASNIVHKVEDAVTPAPAASTPAGPVGTVSPYTQKSRELNPTGVQPQKPSFEGKRVYDGPPLPLGHEPPPGYYIPPPAKPIAEKVEDKVEEVKQTLPLLVPKVKEFAAEEPIISQLASTIDSLTASLSTPTKSPSADANGILSKAQDDLTALNKRLHEVKAAEKERLEKTVGEKTKEFEALLKEKEAGWSKSEQGLKENWVKERQGLVDEWRKELEGELESQRQGIEQRLREEVVSQGIELQRRWLRSIKTQVETERGGRLAKLDTLTTSLKQLERVTLDNSAQLDDNVRLHKIWSALRAVQSKAEAGDVSFDEELRALKSLSKPASDVTSESTSTSANGNQNVITTTLSQLEKSGIASTGVKSFASLSSWFTNSVAPKIHSSSLVPAPEEASVLSHLASAGLSKLLFRPQPGRIEGNNVGAVLARAEYCLAEKDLDGAAREVNTLKGWPGKLADDWLREARRKLEVQQALEVVAAEATLNSLLLA
ncbi:mitochondrial protein [Kwoniella heveanensis CBS 569]|nr:mitochondrial protein [Kwoniella heveanensis CBS 569]